MQTIISVGILSAWLLMALLSPWFSDSGNQIHLSHLLQPPGGTVSLGYDDLGRPLFDRLMGGARISLLVAVGVTSLSMLLGTLLGMLAGYFCGWVDTLISRIIDIFLAFPGLLLAIALAGVLGAGISNLFIALIAVGWIGYARLTRAQVMSLRQRDHVQAAIALGSPTRIIFWRHLLPLIKGPLIVEATFGIAGMVIAEAGLSFLGLGIQAPDPSWGSMIRDGSRYLLVAPHFVIVPGIALSLVVFAVNHLGDRLRDQTEQSTWKSRQGNG